MDIRLKDGDWYFENGAFSYVKGIDEAAQRAMIACTVKKNSFLYDRDLGADTSSLDRTSPDYERALQMALREAVYTVPDIRLTVKAVKKYRNSAVAVLEIERSGETRETEVKIDGEL